MYSAPREGGQFFNRTTQKPSNREDDSCRVKPKPHARKYERKADDRTAITPIEYGGLQAAFDHFNRALFDGALPDVFITYQRKANSAGYFSPDRFSGRVGEFGKHELALNPDGFIGESDEQICRRWCMRWFTSGSTRSASLRARGYHNKEWAAKMKAIGLQPSSTGMVGGKETGQRMTDYPIPGRPVHQSLRHARRQRLEIEPAKRASRRRQEGTEQQGEIHLPVMRSERLGQA